MPVKKESSQGRYRVIRDCAAGQAGDVVQLDSDQAALLVRDGMVTPEGDE